MRSSDFEIPEVAYGFKSEPSPMQVKRLPRQVYQVVPPVGHVNGARLLDACKYDRRLAAVLICTRKNWKEILQSIPSPLSGGVEAIVIQLRQALGLPVD